LPPEQRRAIQLGSVFGRSFRLAGVRALEPNLEGLSDAMEELLDRDLLRSSGADLYTFRHILIREVAYQTLTRSERGALHAAAAVWLERIAAGREDALAELIAFHYREAALIAMAQRPDDPETEQVRQKAVSWLTHAADVAAAGAATVEGARHLRSAIELAEKTKLPDLYQRLGEMGESGDFAVPAYRTALRLCREQGRPPEQELRVMAGLLSIYTRSQGSVADRLSPEEMQQFRADARNLSERVRDETVLAMYLAVDAFFPFWLISRRQATPEELAEANQSAERAIGLARQLDNPNLQSMALDALASIAQIDGDWKRSLGYTRERLAMQDRLSVVEKVDAHSMAAWSSALLGDLHEAERSTAEGLARIQPGQVPAWTLHLVSWRIYVLLLLGRWDDALQMGERARQLWLESGKPAAGYANRGFLAILDIARAREDQQLAETHAAIFRHIATAFPEDSSFRRWLPYLSDDVEGVAEVVAEPLLPRIVQVERMERGLNFVLDHGRPPLEDRMTAMLEMAEQRAFRPLEAQVRRALGTIRRDAAQFEASLSLFEAIDARPYAARVRCELATLTGDEAQMEKGLQLLQSVGDEAQVRRYERLRVG
jgi:hypothetical protein